IGGLDDIRVLALARRIGLVHLRAVVARLVDGDAAVIAILLDVGDVAQLLAVGILTLNHARRRNVGAFLGDRGAVVLAAGALANLGPVVGAFLSDAGVAAGGVGLKDRRLLRQTRLIDGGRVALAHGRAR